MTFFPLFARMIGPPLRAELLRTALTVFAVALGVAVVVAIRLAGDAATGSFRSSLETLSGKAQLEIVTVGGVDEALLGRLVTLPYPLEFQARIEAHATIESTRATVPLIGLDLVANRQTPWHSGNNAESGDGSKALRDPSSVWSSEAVGWKAGDRVRLIVADQRASYTVQGVIEGGDRFLVMDIGAAQQALHRTGRVDRIEVLLPSGASVPEWQSRLRSELPAGVDIRTFGSGTEQNRKMLEAFRWNLRVLSYISLVVGAFLIYNTIAVSVVRRRNEIGVLRAIGATRLQVRLLFLTEAALFGLTGSIIGMALGDVMARGAVRLLAATVNALYVSSTPSPIMLSPGVTLEALCVGLGVSLAAAFFPAREASLVPPVEAMARGQREYHARLSSHRDLLCSFLLAIVAAWSASRTPVNGKPLFGYVACFALLLSSALAIPALISAVSRAASRLAAALLGVEGMLAARSLATSLARTSVLVAALSTAVAMMVSVGIMVGSFRETVSTWMESQLQADLYLRPVGGGAAGRNPVMAPDVADRIEALPHVRAVDRFRLYEISFRGSPALLGGGETSVVERTARTAFLPGQDRRAILGKLPSGDYCIVSEPFANKHGVRAGDRIRLSLGSTTPEFEVLGVYYDYSNERGYVIVDRKTLLRYLPDPALTNLAVYLRDGASLEEARREVERVTAGRALAIFSNRSLRTAALEVFDRTFAITWALEAVAILVAVLGIAGALLALVIDRRRELSLLRFLGGSAQQVRRLLLCEAGLLGLLANSVGLAVGWMLSLILILVINKQSFGWSIRFHWPAALLVTALSLIWIATIVAGLYPARVAVRLNPIEVIHEE
jgi:putative ABC transport system permease protein